MTIPRINADFHKTNLSPRNEKKDCIPLITIGSLQDLSNLGLVLTEGLHILVYMDSSEVEEIESDAEVYYSSKMKCWLAELIGEIRDVPTVPNDPNEFNCISCQTTLHDHIRSNGLNWGDVCPKCSKPIHQPILPPK